MGEKGPTMRGKLDMGGVMGPVWAIGWLFTIGFTGLSTGKAVLALLLWPYYLGSALTAARTVVEGMP